MHKEDCIFCKIIAGQIPAAKFWENEEFIAILDLFPNTKGMSLVIPKQHVASDIFNTDITIVHNGIDAAKIAANKLQTALGATRVCLVTEGMEVDHMHLKLYPVYAGTFAEGEQGYLTTKAGPMADVNELEGLARMIRDNLK